MAHPVQLAFFEIASKHYSDMFRNKKVLEIGALDINGSIRKFFQNCDYLGTDLEVGKGVDLPKAGQILDFPSGSFDLVASTECFEHNPYWAETFVNMLRMMKPDGAIFVSCASFGRGEHGTRRTTPAMSPFTVNANWTYYKNLSEKDFQFVNLHMWLSSWRTFVENSTLLFAGFGLSSKHKITREFVRELKGAMSPTFLGSIKRWLNLALGNRIFQNFYVLVRRYAPCLLECTGGRKS